MIPDDALLPERSVMGSNPPRDGSFVISPISLEFDHRNGQVNVHIRVVHIYLFVYRTARIMYSDIH